MRLWQRGSITRALVHVRGVLMVRPHAGEGYEKDNQHNPSHGSAPHRTVRLLGVVHGPSPCRRVEVHLRARAVYDHSWRGVAGVRPV